jgi:hypothetical protein
MALPASGTRHLIDRCALRSARHRNHRVLLRGALCVGLRLRVRQHLNRRPQLIDQRIAPANPPPLLGTGKRVLQRQQPLAAERGSVPLLVGCDGDLAVIDCRRRQYPRMPTSDCSWRSALSVTQASVTVEIAGVAHGALDALVGHHPGDDQ